MIRQGNSEYWSLSGAQLFVMGWWITNTYVTTDVSNTGKGILVGSDNESIPMWWKRAGGDSVELLVGFDANDTIDLTCVW